MHLVAWWGLGAVGEIYFTLYVKWDVSLKWDASEPPRTAVIK